MSPAAVLLLDAAVTPEHHQVPADKLIHGNPRQTVWMHYADPTRRFFVGIWRCEPGKWRIAYTEEEYCHMLDGRSILCDESGRSVTLSAGDGFVVPRGFVGTWEVVETTTKRFVIYEAAP